MPSKTLTTTANKRITVQTEESVDVTHTRHVKDQCEMETRAQTSLPRYLRFTHRNQVHTYIHVQRLQKYI